MEQIIEMNVLIELKLHFEYNYHLDKNDELKYPLLNFNFT